MVAQFLAGRAGTEEGIWYGDEEATFGRANRPRDGESTCQVTGLQRSGLDAMASSAAGEIRPVWQWHKLSVLSGHLKLPPKQVYLHKPSTRRNCYCRGEQSEGLISSANFMIHAGKFRCESPDCDSMDKPDILHPPKIPNCNMMPWLLKSRQTLPTYCKREVNIRSSFTQCFGLWINAQFFYFLLLRITCHLVTLSPCQWDL